MESLISTFHIDIKLIIAQLINFAIVFVVLYVFALKPLMKLMRERSAKIEQGIKDARNSVEKMQQSEEEYKKMITQAKSEGMALMIAARDEADKKRGEMMNAAKEEVAKIVTQGKNQLVAEKVKMIGEAKAEVVDLLDRAFKKIIGDVDPKLEQELINSAVKDLEHNG